MSTRLEQCRVQGAERKSCPVKAAKAASRPLLSVAQDAETQRKTQQREKPVIASYYPCEAISGFCRANVKDNFTAEDAENAEKTINL